MNLKTKTRHLRKGVNYNNVHNCDKSSNNNPIRTNLYLVFLNRKQIVL